MVRIGEYRRGEKVIFTKKRRIMKQLETGWKSKDGLSFFARIWEPSEGSPRAVVCLVHGVGEHSGRYRHVGEVFTSRGMVLFAPDMRGHGLTEGKRGHLPSAGTIICDIDRYLETARERYPGVPLFLYGHSLGGIFVLFYGLERRQQGIAGVMCTSPGLRTALHEQPVKVMAARVLGSLFPGVSLASGLDSSAISRDQKVVETYRADPLVHDRITLGFGKVMLGVITRTMENIGEFPHPLLLMHGTADTIAFISGSEQVAASLGERCSLVTWKGFYHELHNEPEKEEVLGTMTAWLESRISAPEG